LDLYGVRLINKFCWGWGWVLEVGGGLLVGP
jgi:hypothetical protein